MSTLLLRLSAPLQAWGLGSKFDRRNTQREPTKSAIIGLLASALGRKREDSVQDLVSGLRFGLRADREGQLLRDYQTVYADKKTSYVTHRYYLQDALFLVGLEGEASLLDSLEMALLRPAFPLFLGRRSCPPAGRLVLGIVGQNLEDALMNTPCLHPRGWVHPPRLLIDAQFGEKGSWTQRDLPLSFDRRHRRFADRSLKSPPFTGALPVPSPKTSHDPFSALQGLQESPKGQPTDHDPFTALSGLAQQGAAQLHTQIEMEGPDAD